MQKITFAFPDHNSLWQFKNQTQAINVTITPKKNIISGLFLQQDVELAVHTFNAVTVEQAITSCLAQKDNTGKAMQNWLKNYSASYIDSVKKLKKVVNSIYSLKFF